MKIRIRYFTPNGRLLAERLIKCLDHHEVTAAGKESPLSEFCRQAFETKDALIFIGAAGIAVRAIAPFVRDKLTDPPVIVIDELGNFVIPLLSGHVGGANELAQEIADAVDAVPVVTTATDINDAFSVDLFAKENRLTVENREGIAKVSSSVLEGKPVVICIKDYPPKEKVDVIISDDAAGLRDAASIVLSPKKYAVGIGCRKGKSYEEIRDFVTEELSAAGIDIKDVGCIATIDIKKDEEGLRALSQAWRLPLITFEAAVLAKAEGEFESSKVVMDRVGVDNVCERAAVLAAGPGSELVIKKTARNGVTVAAARKAIKL